MSIEEQMLFINRNECPICQNGPRKAYVDTGNKRRSLMMHLTHSKDITHKLWKHVYYKEIFKHGGSQYRNIKIDEDMIKDAITKTFGEEWIHKMWT